MELIILGSAPGYPQLGRTHSGVYISTKENHFLFDCGDGIANKMLQYKLNGDLLDAIIISHFHPDHSSGIFMVLQMLYLDKRKKDLDIFLPENIERFNTILRFFYLFEEKFSFKINVYLMEHLSSKYPCIVSKVSDHLLKSKIDNLDSNKYLSYSFIIKDEKKIIYTSDINNFDHIKDFIRDSDYVIVDGLHPDANLLISFLGIVKEKVIITHGKSKALESLIKKHKHFELVEEKKYF